MAKWIVAAAATLSVLSPAAASAQAGAYTLSYTTFADGLHPAVTANATLTASPDPFVANGYLVNTITGSRNGQAITGLSDPFSEFYLANMIPGYGFQTYLDSFGITYSVGGTDYQLYRDSGDTSFYHEYEGVNGSGTGRLILASSFSIAPAAAPAGVPEPASWAMMVAGFAAAGYALRRRRGARPAPASA